MNKPVPIALSLLLCGSSPQPLGNLLGILFTVTMADSSHYSILCLFTSEKSPRLALSFTVLPPMEDLLVFLSQTTEHCGTSRTGSLTGTQTRLDQ